PIPVSLAVLFLSRFGRRTGLVRLRQTFVRRCHGRWRCGSPEATRSAAQEGTQETVAGGKAPARGWGASLARASVSRADQTSASFALHVGEMLKETHFSFPHHRADTS